MSSYRSATASTRRVELLELRAQGGQLGAIGRRGHGRSLHVVRRGRAIRQPVRGRRLRWSDPHALPTRPSRHERRPRPLTARGDAIDATAVEGVRAIIADVRGARRRRAARAHRALRRLPHRRPAGAADEVLAPRSTAPPPELRAALEYARRARSARTTRPSSSDDVRRRARRRRARASSSSRSTAPGSTCPAAGPPTRRPC